MFTQSANSLVVFHTTGNNCMKREEAVVGSCVEAGGGRRVRDERESRGEVREARTNLL
jgi:hypothetical protein